MPVQARCRAARDRRVRSVRASAATGVALWLSLLDSSAAGLNLRIERMAAADWRADGIVLALDSTEDALAFHLAVARVDAAGLRFDDLAWRCDRVSVTPPSVPTPPSPQSGQERPPEPEKLDRISAPPACQGPVTVSGRHHGVLRWDAAAPEKLAWKDRAAELQVQREHTDWVLELKRVPLQRFEPLFEVWIGAGSDELSITTGTLSGSLRWQAGEQAVQATLDGSDIGFDARGGRAGGAGIALDGSLQGQWMPGNQLALKLDTQLRAGEWLAGPFYAQPPASLRIGIEATLQQDALRHLEIRAADALGNTLDAALDWAEDVALEQAVWQARLRSEAVERARAPYLEGLLAWAGAAGMYAEGPLAIEANGAAGALQRVLLQSSGLDLHDNERGLAMTRGAGTLGWQREGVGPTGRWTIESLRLAGVDLGGLTLQGQAREGRWSLLQPLQVALFGGSLDVSAAEWAPRAGEALLSAQLSDIELSLLTAWLQWPVIEGRLSGRIPAARYAQQRWVLDGGLSGSLLGGQLRLDALSWERPFGIAPSISADIRFDDLDLEPLTATFGFGAISGRLDGEILGLRMLDGAPVQFDARLRTDPNWKGEQRISQRAVRDLSNVGGAGIAGGLQQSVLRAFDEFSYRRIGLSCKLEQDVCLMGGLDSRNGGYTVVEGAGLPRITVNGFQRRVDWPVLLARLEAATAGRGVRVE